MAMYPARYLGFLEIAPSYSLMASSVRLSRIASSARKRRAYRILMEMDDHLLKDIGLTRDQAMAAWIRESVFRTEGR